MHRPNLTPTPADPTPTPNPTTTPAAAARAALTIIAAALAAATSTACSSRRPPTFQVVAVQQRPAADNAIVLDFTVEGTNPNPFELPLRDVRYTVDINSPDASATTFRAVRSAEATLPRNGSQRFTLPAVITTPDASPTQLPATTIAYRLSGIVEYKLPDPLSDVLFDASVRRPSVPIGINGTLEFDPLPTATTPAP